MIFGHHRIAIPSNHEYSVSQIRMMINEVEEIIRRGITGDEWNNL